eukprot:2116444-Pleurochrysis_carterae.AAC.1
MIPAAVVSARQQLIVLLRSRVEDVVGQDRLLTVREKVRALVEGVLTADVDFKLAVISCWAGASRRSWRRGRA